MFKTALNEEIKVPANIDYLGDLRNFVTKAGRKHNFPASVVNAFKLCVDEAATNIIKHAYRDWAGMITLRVIIKKNSMSVCIIDQGKYFDPSRVDDPDLKRYVDIGKKGGLGIFIMRKLLDDIDYHRTEEGNELRLTKYRDTNLRKKEGGAAGTTLTVSIKTRYSLMTAAALTLIVTVVYFYFFITQGNKVFEDIAATEKFASEEVARLVLQGANAEYTTPHISLIAENYVKERKDIYRLIFTDESDHLIYTNDENLFVKSFNSEYKIPVSGEQLHPFLFKYKTDENIVIYSFKSDIVNNDEEKRKAGNVYLEVKKDYISKKIAAQRLKDLQAALLVLLIGYAGMLVLVYFILNPFRKLAAWVKELGSGNVKDEIDFDSSSEVGELAQAYSQMQDKVRESQKNLAEQERIKTEMQVGQEIQQRLIPREVPKIEGYEIAPYYEPAKELGGDYFDFIEVDKDTLGIVVADVSGKGVPGSLVMAYIKATLRTEARSMKSASEVLARVNDIVVDDMKKGMFVTLFYVIIDSKKRRINYASAGHNPMILYRQGTQQTYYLNPRGFPVGISLPDSELFKKTIESDTIQLNEGDILLIYTDGITEAMNHRRELFSEERLLDAVRKYGNLHAEEFITKIKDEIHSFSEGFEQSDDITVVTFKEKSTPEKIELTRAQKAHQIILKGKSVRDACEEAGITTYAYYSKYKKTFEEEGIDAYSIDETVSVEAKHLSIEEKTKIYDIIKKHPEFGAKRISEELNVALYGYAQINEGRIYDELVRSRLNTRQLREAYIARSGKKKRMKPPGTPMLTLDGKIILSKDLEKYEREMTPSPTQRELKTADQEKPEKPVLPKKTEELTMPKEPDDDFLLESLMKLPLEDLLKKQRETQEHRTVEKQPLQAELEAADESDESRVVEQVEDESILNEIETDESLLGLESVKEAALEDIPSPPPVETLEDIGIEHDFSFRDIWEEENIDLSDDELKEEESETDVHVVDEHDIKDQSNIKLELGTPVESAIKMEELLEETEADEISFEMLTDEASFKDEIFFENNGDDGQLASADGKSAKLEEQPSTEDHLQEEIKQADDTDEVATGKATDQTQSNTIFDDDLLGEEDIVLDDFSFNDLLNEIESDIFYFEGEKLVKEKVEVDNDDYFRAKNAELIQNSGGIDAAMSKKEEITRSGKSKYDQFHEKNLMIGLTLYQEHNYKQAVEQFLKVIEKYPDFKEVYSILGNAYYRNNQIDMAIKSYEQVKQLDPFNADAYENTGVIYANSNKLEDAIKEWKTLLEFRPDREDIVKYIERAEGLLKRSRKF